ncbi:MAG: extracellular solute-binding protein, partial [Anaerolineae bacterium]|nr:extracellular solute-binding protein [Anaerolineae bacterium]
MTKFTLAAALMAASTWGGAALAQQTLTMWYHGAGNDVEQKLINQVISDFNASQSDWKVELQSFPQAAYNDSVVAGALAGNLPDILDVYGPNMPNWAWAGYMQPLPIDESRIADFLPGTKGIWNGQLYSIGLWDAAVALVTRQSTLDELGLRKP